MNQGFDLDTNQRYDLYMNPICDLGINQRFDLDTNQMYGLYMNQGFDLDTNQRYGYGNYLCFKQQQAAFILLIGPVAIA